MILSLAESEAKEAEKLSEMMGRGHDYVDSVTKLIYLLRHSQKPDGIKEEHLKLSRVVLENLVAKKQSSPELLKMLEPKEECIRYIGRI